MLANAAESPASSARFVGQTRFCKTRQLKTRTRANLTWFYTLQNFWQCWLCKNQNCGRTKTPEPNLPKRLLKKWLCEPKSLPEKNEPDKKAWTQFTKTLTEKDEADFRNLTQPKLNTANETDFDESKPLFTKTFDRNHDVSINSTTEPVLETWQSRKCNWQKKEKRYFLQTKDLEKRHR